VAKSIEVDIVKVVEERVSRGRCPVCGKLNSMHPWREEMYGKLKVKVCKTHAEGEPK
jgi:hypothetical protein